MGKDYYQKKTHQRQQSRFNRYIHMMAAGGMPRNKLMFRYLGQNRYMKLMTTMSKQLQSGDSGWIGSMNTIMRLIGKSASNRGYKITKAKILKIKDNARKIVIGQHYKPVRIAKSILALENGKYDKDGLFEHKVSNILGGVIAETMMDRPDPIRFYKSELDDGAIDFQKQIVKLVAPGNGHKVYNHETNPVSTHMRDTNFFAGGTPDSKKRKMLRHFSNVHGYDSKGLDKLYGLLMSPKMAPPYKAENSYNSRPKIDNGEYAATVLSLHMAKKHPETYGGNPEEIDKMINIVQNHAPTRYRDILKNNWPDKTIEHNLMAKLSGV